FLARSAQEDQVARHRTHDRRARWPDCVDRGGAMRHRFIGGALLVMVAAAIPAQHPQNIAKGFAVDKAYEFNGLDQINTFNGNLNVRLPLGQRYTVSSALSYQFSLHYGGNVW